MNLGAWEGYNITDNIGYIKKEVRNREIELEYLDNYFERIDYEKKNREVYMCVLVTQLCLTLCNSMDCSPPGSFEHEILQTNILEWVVISFSRGENV